MSDSVTLSALAKLGDELRAEILRGFDRLERRLDQLERRLDATKDHLERMIR